MRPTNALVHEHETVHLALELLERITGRMARGMAGAEADLERLLEVFRGFVDGCHHSKEEVVLFPAMAATGLPHAERQIAAMLEEHVTAREHVGRLRENAIRFREGQPEAGAQALKAARAYRLLLAAHIEREHQVVFPLAERHLSEACKAELVQRFQQIEREEIGEGCLEGYQQVLKELGERYPD